MKDIEDNLDGGAEDVLPQTSGVRKTPRKPRRPSRHRGPDESGGTATSLLNPQPASVDALRADMGASGVAAGVSGVAGGVSGERESLRCLRAGGGEAGEYDCVAGAGERKPSRAGKHQA